MTGEAPSAMVDPYDSLESRLLPPHHLSTPPEPRPKGVRRAVVKVPGKLMLAGEYAVLAGQPALATTLDAHLTVRASIGSSQDRPHPFAGEITVSSDLWMEEDRNPESDGQLRGSRDQRGGKGARTGGHQRPFLGYKINPGTGVVRAWYGHPSSHSPFTSGGSIGGASVSVLDPEGDRDPLQATRDAFEQEKGVVNEVHDGLHAAPPASHQPLIQAVLRGAQALGIHQGTVHVSSELDVSHGFGSSSALYLGVMAALSALQFPLWDAAEGHHDSSSPLEPVGGRLPDWFLHGPLPLDLATHLGGDSRTLGDHPDRVTTLLWGASRLAYRLQWTMQKRASGYDTLTQLLGGIVQCQPFAAEDPRGGSFVTSQMKNTVDQGYDPEVHETLMHWPHQAQRLDCLQAGALARYAHVFVGGKGAPTGPLVRSSMAWMQDAEQSGFLRELCSLDHQVQMAALKLLKNPPPAGDNGALRDLLFAVSQHRQLLKKMPQYPLALAQTLEEIPGCDRSWSFKTTGAGGEDALLLWGELADLGEVSQTLRQMGWRRTGIGFDRFGLRLHVDLLGAQQPVPPGNQGTFRKTRSEPIFYPGES